MCILRQNLLWMKYLTWKIIGYVKFKLIIQMSMRYSFGISQLRKSPVIMASLPSCRSNMSSGPHPHPSQVISRTYLIQNFDQLEHRSTISCHTLKLFLSDFLFFKKIQAPWKREKIVLNYLVKYNSMLINDDRRWRVFKRTLEHLDMHFICRISAFKKNFEFQESPELDS